MFGELQSALNVIWKAPASASAGVWYLVKSRLLSLSVILVIGFLLLVSLVISTALAAFSDCLDRILPGLAIILRIVHLTLALGFTTVLFAMMFKILPDKPVEWQDVWLGAAVTAGLFTVGKYLISLYIGSSNMASTYGAAGALIIVFVWVYYSAQILLLGAEFAKAYGDQRWTAGNSPAAMAETDPSGPAWCQRQASRAFHFKILTGEQSEQPRKSAIGSQLGLSVITLGVFLRQHLIAEVCSDAQTKNLIGSGSNNFVQPKQSIILDPRQQSIGILTFLHPRTEFIHRKDLRHHEARRYFFVSAFGGYDVHNEPHAVRRYSSNLDVRHLG
jgi:hypothetical protein